MVHHMKKGLLLLTALLLLGSLESPGTALAAADGPEFTLNAVNRGSKVIVEVKAKGLADLYAYQFNLQYEPGKMRFVEADSPISGFTIEPIVKEGDILFAHSKIGNVKGMDGQAALAAFTFERTTGGQAAFTLHRVKLVDSELEMTELDTTVKITSASGLPFKDIAGHWAEASIVQASGMGWVAGYDDETFRPQQQVTRAEFVAMIVRALELPVPAESALTFADQDNIPKWARGYAAAAVEAGMIEGYADGTFQAGRLISRAEMAAIIVRAQGIVPDPDGKPDFADADEIPKWAQPSIAAAVERGWVKGVGNRMFAPLKNAARAETVHLIVQMMLPQAEPS